MKQKKKITRVSKRVFAATMAAVLMVPNIPASAAQEEKAAENNLCFRFDMESLEGNEIINNVTGQAYAVAGNASLNSGKQGQSALHFSGNEYVDLGTEFQPQNAYTMMGWVKQDAGGKPTQAFISRGDSGNPSDYLAILLKDNSIYHNVAYGNGSANNQYKAFLTSAKAAEGKWNHIAVTRDGANVSAYINGEKVQNITNWPANDFVPFEKGMYIGKDTGNDGTIWDEHAFTGDMDDLRLYDAALSADEIKEIYEAETMTSEIVECENGRFVLQLSRKLETAPAQEEVQVKFFEGNKAVEQEITAFSYDEEKNQIIIEFTPFENDMTAQKEIKIESVYQEYTATAAFTLDAGENEAPTVSNVKLTNMSTELLGEEPHVKGMLKAEYEYADADNDAEGDTKYQWYMSDTKDGEYTKIQGIRTQTVILLDKYVGKYLKCEIIPADVHGNKGEAYMTPASEAVMDTEGNPLTDWFYEAQFGVSHHLLSEFVVKDFVSNKPGEKWDYRTQTWNDFIGEFDAEAYAKEISKTGAKFVTITLAQNAAEYCAPNPVYDKYLREAGFLKEGEVNPKTVSFENDLPMKLADALEPYGIKVMLYLPSNTPHSAHWVNGSYDYAVTEQALKGNRGSNGPNSQEAKKILCEMVQWWSEHYGDKIAGWWFDGMYPGGTLESQLDMTQEYNVASLANAAKAGNPYNIVTFNQGTAASWAFAKNTDYHDFTCGEQNDFNYFDTDGRWADGSDDCQMFSFGCLGAAGWQWGAYGTRLTDEQVLDRRRKAIKKQYVLQLDVKVNHYGEIDPDQFRQLVNVKENLVIDRSELEGLIAEAKTYEESNYSPINWNKLQKEIARAQVALDKDDSTQQDIEDAFYQLKDVMSSIDSSDSSRDIPVDGMTATAGSEEVNSEDNKAGNVLDNNSNTLWHTAWGGCPMEDRWIDIALAEPATVGGVKILPRSGVSNGVINTADIWVKTADSEEYVQVSDEAAFGSGGWHEVTFDEIKNVTNVKIQPTSTYGNYASAAEIRLLGEEKEVVFEVDKTALQNAADEAKVLNKAEYTAETWAVLETKLAAAEEVLADEAATDYDVLLAEANLKNAVEKLESIVTVYKVRVNDKVVAAGAYDTKVTVTAPEAPEGQVFAGWYVNDEIVSVDTEYTFYISGDMDLTAAFAEEVKAEPSASVTNVLTTKRADGKYDVKFVGQLVLPKGYTVKEAGLVWSSKDGTELAVGGAAKTTYIKRISDTNQFSVTIKGMPAGNFLRGRIFVKAADADGVEHDYIYSGEKRAVTVK